MSHVLPSDKAEEVQSKSTAPSGQWRAPTIIFPKEVVSVQDHGQQLLQPLAKDWINCPSTLQRTQVPNHLSFVFPCPCLHLACKWTWQPFCYFITECYKMCSYGESWRDRECFSLCLLAVLFHVSQPGSVIYPGNAVVPADPSPHIALSLSTAVHWHASQTLINNSGVQTTDEGVYRL